MWARPCSRGSCYSPSPYLTSFFRFTVCISRSGEGKACTFFFKESVGGKYQRGRGLGFKTECVHSYKHTLRTFRRSIHHKHNSKVKIIFTNVYLKKAKQKYKHHKIEQKQTTMSSTITFHLIVKGSCSMSFFNTFNFMPCFNYLALVV